MGLNINSLRKSMVIPPNAIGVCVWDIGGKLLADADNHFLSMEGLVGDKNIEKKMSEAAYYWLGERTGQPKWLAGARKISDDEYDDQMDRLQDGKIPDPIDAERQRLRRGK